MFYSRKVSFRVFYNSKLNCYYNFKEVKSKNNNNPVIKIIQVPHPELAYKLETKTSISTFMNYFDHMTIPNIEVVNVTITIDAQTENIENVNM